MCHELSVHIEIVFTGGNAESGHVDGYMEHTKEGQGKHGRDCFTKGSPIDLREICNESAWQLPKYCSQLTHHKENRNDTTGCWKMEQQKPIHCGADHP